MRFLENQIWFDLPVDMVYVSKMYVLVAYVTKIILAIAQKNDVKTEYIKSVFYNQKGKEAMVQAIDMGYEIISNKSTRDVVQENRPESNIDGKFEDVKDYLINELCNLLKKKGNEISPPSEPIIKDKTRAKQSFTPDKAREILNKYVNDLWVEIEKRLLNDTEGTTRWSEASSESIFSTLEYVVEDKPSLTYAHSVAMCRIVKEAPSPGTATADKITVAAFESWREESKSGNVGYFTTNDWMLGTVSDTVAKALNCDKVNLPKK